MHYYFSLNKKLYRTKLAKLKGEKMRLTKEEMQNVINEIRCAEGGSELNFNTSEISTVVEYSDGENENFIIEKVDENGGYEGAGEDMSITFKITRKADEAIGYLTLEGYYSSWNDSYYHTVYASEPVEKTIIVYEKVK
jgi:hypothetical protein